MFESQSKFEAINLHPSVVDHHSSGAGAEPGVDPRNNSSNDRHKHIQEDCLIDIVDYSAEDCRFRRMGNEEFVALMREKVNTRENWVKVRWINIGGISWDVISAVALKYDLHSLAVEDIIHPEEQGHNQSQADYYPKHLFLRILCHSLLHRDQVAPTKGPRHSATKEQSDNDGGPGHISRPLHRRTMYDRDPARDSPLEEEPSNHRSKFLNKRPFTSLSLSRARAEGMTLKSEGTLSSLLSKRHEHRKQEKKKIDALKNSARIDVELSPMFISLYRNGTVITIHPAANLEFTAPITARLSRPDAGLRTSGDASLLVQAMLDLTVDRILEVIDEYQDRIYALEHDILLRPNMDVVRRLHILSGDLILHKRTLDPIKTLIYGLRRYDLERFIAAGAQEGYDMAREPSRSSSKDRGGPPSSSGNSVNEPDESRGRGSGVPPLPLTLGKAAGAHYPAPAGAPHLAGIQEGYMSHRARIYLADVDDHMRFVLTSLDMFAGISENLINYAFNMASYEINEVMRRLTLVTIIFLPLSLLAGYFGMNFDKPWIINGHSDLVFWIIALPVMGVLLPIFVLPDILRLVRYIRRWMRMEKAAMKHALH